MTTFELLPVYDPGEAAILTYYDYEPVETRVIEDRHVEFFPLTAETMAITSKYRAGHLLVDPRRFSRSSSEAFRLFVGSTDPIGEVGSA